MIEQEQETKISQLYYRDHWKVGTIASHLGIHPDTVKRALKLESKKNSKVERKSEVEDHRSFIEKTLKEYPNLCATRLLEMLRAHGYKGSVYPVRRMKQELKPTATKAFLDLHFTPGEMAQVDWANFGTIDYGLHKRPLNAFVMVLAHSRMIYAQMFHDMKTARVLEGHVNAFQAFKGAPRVVLYDNMKTAVIENQGGAIRFQPDLLELAKYYQFLPRACNPRSGWEKGRVERAIRYLRESFFAARTFQSLTDLNTQLKEWLSNTAPKREWPDDRSLTVQQVFEQEPLGLLPRVAFDAYEEVITKTDKKSFVSFDTNLYPIDPEHCGKVLTLRATHDTVAVYSDVSKIHTYARCWSKREKIRLEGHQERIAELRGIKEHRSKRHALERTLDCGSLLLKQWAELEENIQSSSKQLLQLIRLHGKSDVEAAVSLAIEQKTPRVCSIAHILTENTESRQPSVRLKLKPEHENIDIQSHTTDTYDELYS